MKIVSWIYPLLVWQIAVTSVQAGLGPLTWTDPTNAPQIHQGLTEKQYTDQLADLLGKFKPDQIDADVPWAGARVLIVYPKSQAKALGIMAGDVLATSNGQQVFDPDDWIKHRDAGDDTATVWSAVGGKKKISMAPGIIGVGMRPYLRPEVLYLRELPAGASPDPSLFAAGACAQDTPDLARAVLAHLVKQGNTDQHIYFIDAIAAMAQGNFDDAVASGMWAMQTGTDFQKRALAPLMRAAALASFRLELADKIEADYPFLKVTDADEGDTGKDHAVDLTKTVERCRELQWTSNDNCADAFAKLKSTDETANMTNAGKGAGGPAAAEAIRKSRHAPFNAPDNEYNLYVLGPPGPSVKLTAKCRFSPNARKPDEYAGQTIKFGVSLKGKKLMPIAVSIDCDGQIDIGGSNIPSFNLWIPRLPTPGKPIEFKVIVVDHRCEVDVDDIRIFNGPILENEKSRQLCMVFHATGVKGQLHDVSWEVAGNP